MREQRVGGGRGCSLPASSPPPTSGSGLASTAEEAGTGHLGADVHGLVAANERVRPYQEWVVRQCGKDRDLVGGAGERDRGPSWMYATRNPRALASPGRGGASRTSPRWAPGLRVKWERNRDPVDKEVPALQMYRIAAGDASSLISSDPRGPCLQHSSSGRGCCRCPRP